jgi:hypothetical protein
MEQLKGRRLIALDRPGFGLSDPVLGAKLGAIRCGRLWTPVESKAFLSGLYGRLWTPVDPAWRSTDQEVGGSSPSGCTATLAAPKLLNSFGKASTSQLAEVLVRLSAAPGHPLPSSGTGDIATDAPETRVASRCAEGARRH